MGRSGAECFLIDTSAAMRIQRPACRAEWGSILWQGRVGMCPPTEAEMLYSARSADEYEALGERLSALYAWRAVPDDPWSEVRAVQRELARAGCHRSAGVVDLLVAVTALHHRLTLLHYDRDFETIAQHTGLRTQWVAEPGGVD
ncbi:PIN domain nuclease [Streptomyces varsoviensis]|uniref:PIN domain nuclease n=1 Tax=Streptomyces varsoviensis TaxID=67373 RepID=UPI0033FB9CF1